MNNFFTFQGKSRGTAAGWLTDEELISLQNQFTEKYISAFPLLSLFRQEVHSSNHLIIQKMTKILGVGKQTARPEPGRRLDLDMIERVMVETFFDQYILEFDGIQHMSLTNPSGAMAIAGEDGLRAALRYLTNGVGQYVETYMRTLHLLVAGIMSTPNGYTLTTADGVEHDINWGFQTSTYGADWETASTDVLSEFAGMLYKFTKRNQGRKPNLFVFNSSFHNKFLLKNDELRGEFITRHPDIAAAIIPGLSIPQAARDRVNAPKVLFVDDSYVDESSSAATGEFADLVDVWPHNIFGMGYQDPSEDNFVMNTVRTLDNNMQGGLHTSMFQDGYNPPCYKVRVSGNHVPSWALPSRFMICKVSAANTHTLPSDVSP